MRKWAKPSGVICQRWDHVRDVGVYHALTFQFKFKFRLLNPVWTVIVYDHKNPPSLKTILEIDAFNLVLIGDIYTEEIIDA